MMKAGGLNTQAQKPARLLLCDLTGRAPVAASRKHAAIPGNEKREKEQESTAKRSILAPRYACRRC
ncbi:MAG: hypothetical protein ONB24_07685 [candidate division KSB1 bacterium]|nr:hypothetical protein [candidate division KSB1 bacterium]